MYIVLEKKSLSFWLLVVLRMSKDQIVISLIRIETVLVIECLEVSIISVFYSVVGVLLLRTYEER